MLEKLPLLNQSCTETLPFPSGDTNPIFVLEAKLAMMLRIAQIETGGRRLIQAGLLKTMGACDFISRQPYLEDMDCKWFRPEPCDTDIVAYA